MTETPKDTDPDLPNFAETPAQAAAEANQAQLDAQAAVAEGVDGDGEGILAEEEGIS